MTLTWPARLPAWGSVVLRPFRETDLLLVAELAADPYIPMISSIPVPFTEEEGRAYIARQHQRLPDGTGYSFAVAAAANDRALAGAGLWLREIEAGRATAGYAIAPSARRRGIATAALTTLTRFAWVLSELHRVEVYIEPWNTASIRTAQNCGYGREGLLRSHQEIGGIRRDMLLYAAVRDAEEAAGGPGRVLDRSDEPPRAGAGLERSTY